MKDEKVIIILKNISQQLDTIINILKKDPGFKKKYKSIPFIKSSDLSR